MRRKPVNTKSTRVRRKKRSRGKAKTQRMNYTGGYQA